jgi:hypothetical protein
LALAPFGINPVALIAWRTDGDIRVGRVNESRFRIVPAGGMFGLFKLSRLSNREKKIGDFGSVEGAMRCADEIIRSSTRARSQPHSFGRNPSRFGDSFTNPVRIVRGRGHGPD